MRELYLVPILHMSADMGSLASALDETAKAEFGQEVWQTHKGAVSSFWDSIGQFFDALDVKGFKIYQDGMVANGADGIRIIREGISQGSKNYEIIGKLLQWGAVLVKTEDPVLVKQEYAYIAKIAHSKSPKEKEVWALRYKLARGKLLRQRDDFIAKNINETLEEGETAIFFIGAEHDVVARLAGDIKVAEVKELAKVKEYHRAFIGKRGHHENVQQLADYLVSPIPKYMLVGRRRCEVS